ncbi:MAG: right-handed parallel beta-helix repeat-containing protein [Leptolyngbyaceae cyanobacterium bins.349]|nr:right-handed parallel beta-helix repeat-containing protein [Leptolyngbyaceae cyanobacterium bins.349]
MRQLSNFSGAWRAPSEKIVQQIEPLPTLFTMPGKRLGRVTCAAGLLLTELVPTPANAQTVEPPDESNHDSVPVTSDRHSKILDEATHNSASTTPERTSVVESKSIAIAVPSKTPFISQTASPPAPIAQPETFPARPTTQPAPPSPTASATPSPQIAVATRSTVPTIAQPAPVSPSASPPVPGSIDSRPVTQSPPSTPNATPSVSRAQDIAVARAQISTRAQDLLPPRPAAIAVSQPEVIQTKALSSGQPDAESGSAEERGNGVSGAPALPARPGAAPSVTQAPTTAPNPVSTTHPPISPKVGGTFTTGPGVGYSSSFTGIKGFLPITQRPGQTITFTEGQAFVDTGNGNPGANLVVGHRVYDQKSDRIYGGYLAYDHRNTGKNSFNQVGLGLETLGRSWDARVNAYLPIGDTRQLTSETSSSTTTLSGDPFFTSNFLGVNRTIQQQIHRRFEAAAAGVDVEAGGKIASLGRTGELRGYGGMYYFGAPQGEGTVGWRTRLEARPNENLQVGVALSRDNNYGTNVALTLGVTFPTNGSGTKRDRPVDPLVARLGDSVYRNSQIVLDRQVETRRNTVQDVALLTNPATGQPWRFRHAVPGVGTGAGTFENPTGTVAEALAVAQPDDIVYVQPGTNPGIPAFTIPDRVQVLSTGPVQRIDTVERGNLALPLSGAGVLPTVTNTVTLGNSTTLSGFAITAPNGAGIVGNNLNQVTIRDNAIANTGTQGILLNNVSGPVAITDNTIQRAGAEGISLNNNQGQVDLLLTRNQILNSGRNSPDGDGVNLELRNNATGNFTVTNNTIANSSGSGGIADGVEIQLFNGANGTFNLADNIITRSQRSGVAIAQEATAQGTFNLSRNNIFNNLVNGVDLALSDNAQNQLNLDGNTIANNRVNGVQAVVSNQASSTLNVTNNTINNNQDSGILLQTADQARITANLLNNTITNNPRNGILTRANDTSQLRVLAQSNQITGNGAAGAGVSINNEDNALTVAGIRNNTITGNGSNDVEVINIAPGNTCVQPLNNAIGSLTFDDDNGSGGRIQVEDGLLPTNTIGILNTLFWSNTTVPGGTCTP